MTDIVIVSTKVGSVAFETAENSFLTDVSSGSRLQSALGNLSDVMTETILACYESISCAAAKLLDEGAARSMEVSFGLKVGAEGNVFVAKGTAEANIEVKLVWEK